MAEERVLLTDLSDPAPIAGWAGQAHLLVGVGTMDEVRAARRACAGLENVMFIEGTRDEIAWQPFFFTLILDPGTAEPTPAIERMLAEGGRIARTF